MTLPSWLICQRCQARLVGPGGPDGCSVYFERSSEPKNTTFLAGKICSQAYKLDVERGVVGEGAPRPSRCANMDFDPSRTYENFLDNVPDPAKLLDSYHPDEN